MSWRSSSFLVIVPFSLLPCLKWVWAALKPSRGQHLSEEGLSMFSFVLSSLCATLHHFFKSGHLIRVSDFREHSMLSQHIPSPEFYTNIP